MNVLLRITASGAFGGFLAAMITRATGVGMFAKWSPMQDFGAEMLFGLAAALFGVYLFTESEPSGPRSLVFALACGLAWQPIVAGASTYVKQYTTTKEQVQNANTAYQSLQNPSQPPTQTQVKDAVDTTSTALQKLPDIANGTDHNQIVAAAQGVVTQVAANPTTDPNYKIEALRNLGVSAAADAPAVSSQTVQSIRSLANDSPDPEVKKNAAAAINAINLKTMKR